MNNITPSSISKETKSRFDLLLKNALTKAKKHFPIEKDSKTESCELQKIEIEKNGDKSKPKITKRQKPVNKNLDTNISSDESQPETSKHDDNEVFKKPPVPLPRSSKTKLSPIDSPICTPKTMNLNKKYAQLARKTYGNDNETSGAESDSSANTYTLNKDHSVHSSTSSLHSDGTYDLNRKKRSTQKSPLELEMEKFSVNNDSDTCTNETLKTLKSSKVSTIQGSTPESKPEVVRERKKWNKEDTVLFIKPQITYQNPTDEFYSCRPKSKTSNHNSTKLSTSSNRLETIGDVIIHNSPSSASSGSVKVLAMNSDIKKNEHVDEDLKSYDDDECIEFEENDQLDSKTTKESDSERITYIECLSNLNEEDSQISPTKNIPLLNLDSLRSTESENNIETWESEHSPYSEKEDIVNLTSDEEAKISSELKSEAKTEKVESSDISSESEFKDNTLKDKKIKYSTIDETKRSASSKESSVNEEVLSYEHIFGLTIHKMDNIVINSLTVHPLVKVHIVDLETGEYLKKSNSERAVCYYYENTNIDYIVPILTHEYNFIEKRSFYPQWEETLIYNEDFNYFINDRIVIFFEIVDFINYSNLQSMSKAHNDCWYKIAWAFLKIVGKDNSSNTEKKVRLQLFKPNSRASKKGNKTGKECDIYKYWLKKSYQKYPGTLYVTIKRLIPNYDTPKVLRSQNPTESEYETTVAIPSSSASEQSSSENEIHNVSEKTEIDLDIENLQKHWIQTTNQTCKVPNQLNHKLKAGSKGCLVLKFSNNGQFIACSANLDDIFNIIVYKISNREKERHLHGHNGIIYALEWSLSDQFLLSASADCTVYIWNISSKSHSPLYMLPHPSYVYTANFCPNASDKLLIATGSYDTVVRIWCENAKTKKSNKHTLMCTFTLVDELENHDGYITTLCFDRNGTYMYTGDSLGLIVRWLMDSENYHFTLDREYKIREMREKIINTLICHSGGQRLLIHARDGVLRMMDIATGCIMQWFSGHGINAQTRCGLSPCGSLLFSSGGNGTLLVWNADTGRQEAIYNLREIFLAEYAIHCIDYNPKYHMIAVAHYGHFTPVLIYQYSNNKQDTIPYLKILNKYSENQNHFIEKVHKVTEQINSEKTSIHSKPTLENIIEKMDNILPLKNKNT